MRPASTTVRASSQRYFLKDSQAANPSVHIDVAVSTWQASSSVWLLFPPAVMPKMIAANTRIGNSRKPGAWVNQKKFFFNTESPHGATFATGVRHNVFLGTRHGPRRGRIRKAWPYLMGCSRRFH